MIRLLPLWIELALLVFCLIDCIQTDSAAVRNLSKTLWVVLIILVPLVGGIAWLVVGRPVSGEANQGRGGRSVPWPATRTAGYPEYERPAAPRGPDDDPDFLADLRASDSAHEKMLAEWQQQLQEREERLRQEGLSAREPDGLAAQGTLAAADDEGTPSDPSGADPSTDDQR